MIINMTDEEFKLLIDFTTQKCGITYNERQKYIFQQKLSKRLDFHGFKAFKDYYYLLKYNTSEDELQELYNVLTVNETYFLREKEHILELKDNLIPELLKNKAKKQIKILSAGCSTGEEVYSIALLLNDLLKNNIEILITGLDISKRAIDIATSGIYRKISLTFRAVGKDFINTYFDESKDSYKIKDFLKKNVTFKCENLFNSPTLASKDKYDFIFCRNVMIYFEKNYKQNLVNNFYNHLNNKGYFIVSNTENLNDLNTNFTNVKKGNLFFYHKD
ncbi:MAG: protein-glutamate O-methyltransferase CheR [Candidatus Sericytochromatia bacterium]